MSAYLYDEALLQKIKHWTEKTKINILGNDQTRRLFEISADMNNDEPLTLPMITISRDGGYRILNMAKNPLSYDGAVIGRLPKKNAQLNAIPIEIEYQIDVYTRYLEEADLYTRDLVFNIINHPTLEIVIPYNGVNYSHKSNIMLSSDVSDTSGINERLVPGQFTRLTLTIAIDDAYLFSAPLKDRVSISDDINFRPGVAVPQIADKTESIFIIEDVDLQKR